MFCCSITWFIATVLCAFFVPLILLLFLTGHIALLPEVTKLLLVAWWCYIEALFNWIAPRKRKSIEGLTAVVTGGGHGIGREIALGLAKKGETCILLQFLRHRGKVSITTFRGTAPCRRL